jgi:hypothetical protein
LDDVSEPERKDVARQVADRIIGMLGAQASAGAGFRA